LVSLFAARLSANETIVVAAFEYPPIYQNGKEKGLSGDIVVAAFKAVDIDVDMQFLPVSRMVATVKEGLAVCGIGGSVLFAAPDVAENVTVSSVIQYVSQTFLYNCKEYPAGIAFSSLSDMKNYRIGVLGGSGIMRFLNREKGLNLVANTSHDGTARQLQSGRVDVWAVVDLTGIRSMKRLFPKEASDYRCTKPFNLGDVSVVFSKKLDPNDLYDGYFKKGLATIKKNGTYLRLMAQYYGGEAAINRDALVPDMRP
jgi:polar amino acid transport system substrate-binding protein